MIIASTGGKGGTGKTLVAVNFAVSLVRAGHDVLLVDCDADNPNAAILLGKDVDDPADRTADPESVQMFVPEVAVNKCTGCGTCARVCRQNAIFQIQDQPPVIIDHLCSGCELCYRSCPEGAILDTGQKEVGKIFTLDRVYETPAHHMDLWVGRLNPGEVRTVKVLEELFEKLDAAGARDHYDYIVLDTSPGAHCDVEFALDQADKIICVTEPTPFGAHDLKRVLDLLKILGKRARVILNREGMTDKNALILDLLAEYDTLLLGRLPLSETILKAYARGVPFVTLEEEFPAKTAFQELMTAFDAWSTEPEPPRRQRGTYNPLENLPAGNLEVAPTSTPQAPPTLPGAQPTDEDKAIFRIGVVSGKGGVGKTVVSGSLAVLLKQADEALVAGDCDVDAPNLAIILEARDKFAHERIKTTEKAVFLPDKCVQCRQCVDDQFCNFHALFWDEVNDQPVVDFLACEGCGSCAELCPEGAFFITAVESGTITSGQTKYDFPIVSGETILGATTSGKMVTETKNYATKLASKQGLDLLVVDGPPGIGCPVVATLTGLDYIVVVMEPTPTALHDADRVMQVIQQLQRPVGIVLNKADAWAAGRDAVHEYATAHGISILGEIPVDLHVPEAVANAKPVVVAFPDTPAAQALRALAAKLRSQVIRKSEVDSITNS